MSKFKKFLGFMMAALMVFALTPMTAFADEAKGTIAVNKAVEGQTYTIYKVLDLESYNTDAKAYSYKPADGWDAFFKAQTADGVTNPVVKYENGYVTWIGDDKTKAEDAAAFAQAALTYAKDNEDIKQAAQSVEARSTTVTFSELDLGYYLLDSTLGVFCGLNTTKPNATIEEKNPEPTVDKQVQENSKIGTSEEWGKTNDANIGDTVNFKSTISVNKPGASQFVYHDKMSAGLTFNGTVTVKKNGVEVQSASGNFTLIKEGLEDGCAFEVVFNESFCNSLLSTDKIEIAYSATLNDQAVVSDGANTNDAKLVYGENGGSETKWNGTKTYTWKAQVFKFTGNDKGLAGAKFTLSLNANGSDPIQFIKGDTENEYRVATADEIANDAIGKVTEIETPNDGRFSIKGLDAGIYYLTETEAPAGYNKLSQAVTVFINSTFDESGASAEVSYGFDTQNITVSPEIKVENKTGLELPSTGGIGTTLFYVGGGILVLGAVVYLVTRRRANSTK